VLEDLWAVLLARKINNLLGGAFFHFKIVERFRGGVRGVPHRQFHKAKCLDVFGRMAGSMVTA